jgi:hypothetical protein
VCEREFFSRRHWPQGARSNQTVQISEVRPPGLERLGFYKLFGLTPDEIVLLESSLAGQY